MIQRDRLNPDAGSSDKSLPGPATDEPSGTTACHAAGCRGHSGTSGGRRIDLMGDRTGILIAHSCAKRLRGEVC